MGRVSRRNAILIGGFAVLLVFEAGSLAVTPSSSGFVNILLTMALMGAVLMGKAWARILMSVLLILAGVIGLTVIGELAERGATGILVIVASAFHVGFGLYLAFGIGRALK